ncbi:hypothetical protein GCM10010207_61320 [Streptomyces atratus]|nr:hypothetical protein GCM10010207_61320 [Streptomyces atratus]
MAGGAARVAVVIVVASLHQAGDVEQPAVECAGGQIRQCLAEEYVEVADDLHLLVAAPRAFPARLDGDGLAAVGEALQVHPVSGHEGDGGGPGGGAAGRAVAAVAWEEGARTGARAAMRAPVAMSAAGRSRGCIGGLFEKVRAWSARFGSRLRLPRPVCHLLRVP